MARTALSRRQAYDNIAIGSAISSQERVLPDASGVAAGVTAPAKDQTTFAHSERLYGASPGIENMTVGVDPTNERPGGA